jgi:ribonuclease G
MKAKKRIVISANEWETRVGILEDGQLVQFYVESEESRNLVGRVYKGRVENVVKGLRGAFVNVGLRKNGFLPMVEIPEFDALDDDDDNGGKSGKAGPRTITLDEGEDILVQVVKDPFAQKGARLTSYVSLPGRHLVYFPNAERIGVSRRIRDRRERSRLRSAARKFKSRHAGLIIRTMAEDAKIEYLRDEYKRLEHTWETLRDRAEAAKSPAVVYDEPSIGIKLVRDLLDDNVEKVVLDFPERYEEIQTYLTNVAPKLRRKIELYRGQVPLLEQTGIEAELDRVFQKRLWIKSGGFITIDQTEAMVAIDVNTGRSSKEDDPERLIFSTNMEATAEIARQIRLRDLAGLIVIDFIDMEDQKNTEQVVAELRRHLANDRAKADYSRMSRFGLLEMTRERTRPGMMYAMSEVCPTCKGTGRVRSRAEVAMKIERAILAKLPKIAGKRIRVVASPWMTDHLTADRYDRLVEFARRYKLAIDVKTDYQIQPADFRLLVDYA